MSAIYRRRRTPAQRGRTGAFIPTLRFPARAKLEPSAVRGIRSGVADSLFGKLAGGRGALGLLRRGEACRNPGGNESTSLLSNFSRARGGAKLAGNLSCVAERIPLHCEGKRLDVTLAARWWRRRAASHKCSSRSSVSTVLPREWLSACHSWRRGGLFLATQSAVSNAPKVQTQHAEVSWQEQSTPGMTNTLYSFGKGRDRLPSGPI